MDSLGEPAPRHLQPLSGIPGRARPRPSPDGSGGGSGSSLCATTAAGPPAPPRAAYWPPPRPRPAQPHWPAGGSGAGSGGRGRGHGGGSRAAIGWRGGVRIVRPRGAANGEGARPGDAHDAMGRGPPAPPAPAGPARARQRRRERPGGRLAAAGNGTRRSPPSALSCCLLRSNRSPAGAARLPVDLCRCLRPLLAPALRKRTEYTGGDVVMAAACTGCCHAGESV